MSNNLFVENLKEAVRNMVTNKKEYFQKNKVTVNIIRDDDIAYCLDLLFPYCLAGILIGEPSYVPFRYISMEVITKVDGEAKLLYYFYDKDEQVSEILKEIWKGIEIALSYSE